MAEAPNAQGDCKMLAMPASLLVLAFLAQAAPGAAPPIRLAANETIVFLGDSITQQNLWTAYVETFLVARHPDKRLVFHNVGVGGNVVADGLARFDRDVAARKPSTVLVAFGMNDGRYVPPDPAILKTYLDGQRTLVARVKGLGARPILVAPSAVKKDHALYLGPYNETLAGFARELAALAARERLPFVDLFTAFRPFAERSERDPELVPDGVHPNAVGHFLLADAALRRFEGPRGLGSIAVSESGVAAPRTVAVANVERSAGRVAFDMRPAFLPYHVPAEARRALALVPFERDLNAFTLDVSGWGREKSVRVTADGAEIAVLGPSERGRPIDLALADEAPWALQGRSLWREAQARFDHHTAAWRRLGVDASPFARALPTTAALADAEGAYVDEAGARLRELVAPRRYRIVIEETDEIPVRALELSPIYPWDLSAADFETKHPPETDPAKVAWRKVPLDKRSVDLAALLGQPQKSVVYARLVLEATTAADVQLTLGSNDGLTVLVDGERRLAKNVKRTLRLGDESLTVALAPGRHTLLFRVTQVELKHGLALRLESRGPVRVVAP